MTDPALVLLAALSLLVGLSAYAVLAGADFGGGVWDLFARGPRRTDQRAAIERASGPVWEVNHVWIIFVIVVLFTAFPKAFAALCIGLFAPLTFVLLGIVLRGSAFAFRAHSEGQPELQRWLGIAFSVSSLVTPFALGLCAGAVAAGALEPAGDGWATVPVAELLRPFPLVTGLLAVLICSYLAAVFLTREADGDLREDFRRRALVAGGALLVLSAVGLVLEADAAPVHADALLAGRGLPFALAAGLCGAAGLAALAARRYRWVRPLGVAFVLAVLWGWAVAQWPYAVTPHLTFEAAASSPAMLRVYLVCLAIGGVILVPALYLLFRLFKGGHPEAGRRAEDRA
ncbi:MAG: cytochrome d ubiquinol oxidase subunit II [Chloroflexota bacterium]